MQFLRRITPLPCLTDLENRAETFLVWTFLVGELDIAMSERFRSACL